MSLVDGNGEKIRKEWEKCTDWKKTDWESVRTKKLTLTDGKDQKKENEATGKEQNAQ